MRGKAPFLLGLAVGLGVAGLLRRRRVHAAAPVAGSPAEELRRKLAETREQEVPSPAPPRAGEPQAESDDEMSRVRRRVLEEGRATVEEMRRDEAPPAP